MRLVTLRIAILAATSLLGASAADPDPVRGEHVLHECPAPATIAASNF